MPPRVTFWTGLWAPGREGLSNEVAALALVARTTAIVSFSRGQRSGYACPSRVVRLSGAQSPLLRLLALTLERAGEVTHIVGALDAWHFLRYLGRRPMLFTVTMRGVSGLLSDRRLYAKVGCFAVESEAERDALMAGGVSGERIEVVYPGVDLQRFRPTPVVSDRFRVLFASTPADPAEFDARGVPLLVGLARARPDIDVVCAWRAWGSAAAAAAALEALAPPPNFIVQHGNRTDMAEVYASAHAVAAPFGEGAGKSCPNSVIEGLACGRPALVADACGISDVVARAGAGVRTSRTVDALAAGVERLQADALAYQQRARALAEQAFDVERFRTRYAALYTALATRGCA